MNYNENRTFPITVGVVGTDGISPLYEPDARFVGDWNMKEIYLGEEGGNKFVPKVGDLIHDTTLRRIFIVTKLDPVTFIPEWEPYNLDISEDDSPILSLVDHNFVVYYDKSTNPYTLKVDDFLRIASVEATYARIYRGHEIIDRNIISRMYDNSGNFLGHDIPLVSSEYTAERTIATCNCNVELERGEGVIIVVFDSEGKFVRRVRAIIYDTTYFTQSHGFTKYVEQISLKTAFLSETDDKTINYPVNLVMNSFNPIGVVHFNDGTTAEYPVDGSRFSLEGADILKRQFDHHVQADYLLSTIIGQKIPLVLTYRLGPGEATSMSVGYTRDLVARPYDLYITNSDRSYGVRIFTYPEWISNTQGYRLRHYLLGLNRDQMYDITELVRISTNSPAFNPTAYNIVQTLTLQVDLSDVSTAFTTNEYIHSQVCEVILRARASDDRVNNIWEVSQRFPSTTPLYGTELRVQAIDTAEGRIQLKADNHLDLEEWLEQVYYRTQPLVDPETETGPIRPTHVGYKYGNEVIVHRIEEYDKPFIFKNSRPVLYSNLEIIFYKETSTKYLVLSVANITIRR